MADGSYIVWLSANLDGSLEHSLNPMEVTLMEVEPHGAVSIYRLKSDERAERFELSAAEVDALVVANRRRCATVKWFQAQRSF